jgi:chromosome segregation ATPase
MNSTNPNTNNDVARLRWELKISEEDGITPYLWDNRKYDNYDWGSLCRILNEYEEKTNEVARLREENQKIRHAYLKSVERDDFLTQENAASKAEVERLNNTLENTRISRDTMIEDRNLLDQELAASQAEVEKIKQKRNRIGVEIRGEYLPKLKDLEAEVARLRSQLARSVEIAETACKYLDTGGWNEDEMYSGKEGWVTETEINEVCATLAVLKSEIK